MFDNFKNLFIVDFDVFMSINKFEEKVVRVCKRGVWIDDKFFCVDICVNLIRFYKNGFIEILDFYGLICWDEYFRSW